MRAFGGGELAGTNMARTIFLDEAGISRPDQEPFVVVAGVIINNDNDWKRMEDHLWQMVTENFEEAEWPKAFFHAYALYSGRTPFDAARGWDEKKRFRVLDELANFPSQYAIPIVYGFRERALHADAPPNSWIENKTHAAQVVSTMICMQHAEMWMRMSPGVNDDEIAQLVLEDQKDVRRYMKEIARVMRNPPAEWVKQNPRGLPLTRLVGSPHFEEKQDVSLLQIADVCAYVIKRQLMRDPMIERFFRPMRKCFPFANDINPEDPMYLPWDGPHS